MNLYDAESIAVRFAAHIADACESVRIAGSIRRRKPTVSDAEIVCIPKLAPADALFDNGEQRSLLEPRLKAIVGDKFKYDQQTRRNGPRYKRFVMNGLPIDLFIVMPPASPGLMLLIRTGPEDFSREMASTVDQGGKMPRGFKVAGGQLWKNGEPIPTPTERSYFEAIGVPYIEPEHRQNYAPFSNEKAAYSRHG